MTEQDDREHLEPKDAPELPDEGGTLAERAVSALRTIYDPEIPVDIYELGLVYEIDAAEDGRLRVVMTLTSPHCPVAESLPAEVQAKLAALPGVRAVDLSVTWDPPWGPDRMSEAAKLQLGMV